MEEEERGEGWKKGGAGGRLVANAGKRKGADAAGDTSVGGKRRWRSSFTALRGTTGRTGGARRMILDRWAGRRAWRWQGEAKDAGRPRKDRAVALFRGRFHRPVFGLYDGIKPRRKKTVRR